MSNRIWITEKWMIVSDLEVYRYIKEQIFLEPFSEKAYNNSLKILKFIPFGEMDFIAKTDINNFTILIVITPRTINWINNPNDSWYNIYSQKNSTIFNFTQFMNETYFHQIYSNNNIYLLKCARASNPHDPK
jgi:hypothetical protein